MNISIWPKKNIIVVEISRTKNTFTCFLQLEINKKLHLKCFNLFIVAHCSVLRSASYLKYVILTENNRKKCL